MITVSNIQRHPGKTWQEYCQLPGMSFSALKQDGGPPVHATPGMHLGTLVHQYLMKPKEYAWVQPSVVVPIARALSRFVHPLMQPEVPFTCNLHSAGFTFAYRGIPDLPLLGHLVIDIKILAGDLDTYMRRFGYAEQVRGYMLGCEAPAGMIASWNKTKQRVETCRVEQDTRWWEQVVTRYGTVVNSAPEVNGVTK
jgi:hypothetical protein